MLRDMMIGERPHISSAGAASFPILSGANSFIYKHFLLTVHFPAVAPGTPYSAENGTTRHAAEGWLWPVSAARLGSRLSSLYSLLSLCRDCRDCRECRECR